eukprot:2806594-Alexandrium_andersonii.AAC.1
MSASLVGSEMCIRDSSWPPPKGPRRGPAAGRRRPRTPTSRPWEPRAAAPVSYTHLTLPTICSV